MKNLLFIPVLFISIFAFSQVPVQYLGIGGNRVEVRGQLQSDSVFFLPQYNDTLFNPGRAGAIIYRQIDGQLYMWNSVYWTRLTGVAWGTIPGNINNQTDLQTEFATKQNSLSNGYGWKIVGSSGIFDSANARKVDSVYRVNDTTVGFSINTIPYTFKIRGNAAGAGSVTSIGLAMPPIFTVTGSPVTTTGTLIAQFNNQGANTFLAGPTSGGPTQPTFRSLVIGDLPTGIPVGNLNASTITIAMNLGGAGTAPSVIGSPVSIGGTLTLNIPNAGLAATGFLTAADWNTFNNKVTSVNALTGVVVIGNADSIKKLPVDTTVDRNNYVLTFDSANHKWYLSAAGGGGAGSVTSVGLALPGSVFSVSGSPVTTTGTLTGTFATQTQNKGFMSPNGSTGVPTFRALVNNDLPASGVTPGSYTITSLTVNSQGIITSASNGTGGPILSLNGLNAGTQVFAVGTAGTNFNIVSATATHTFNIPYAQAGDTGLLRGADWVTFNNKQPAGNYITALTGDGTAAGPGSVALTLATVNANVGTWGDGLHVPKFTVNAKGLITGVTSVLITSGGGGIDSIYAVNGLHARDSLHLSLGGKLDTVITTVNGVSANILTFDSIPYTQIRNGRFEVSAGAAVAAANNLTLGTDGNLFSITGNTQINAITTANWQAGSTIAFIFTGTPVLKHNTAGGAGTAVMLLAGNVDYTAAAGDYIAFQYNGTTWHETNRKVATGGVFTLNNGLTLTGTNGQLGGSLTKGTFIEGANSTYGFFVDSLLSGQMQSISPSDTSRYNVALGSSSVALNAVTQNDGSGIVQLSHAANQITGTFQVQKTGATGYGKPNLTLLTTDSSATVKGNKVVIDGGIYENIVTTGAGTYTILATDVTVVATGTTSTWTFPTAVTKRRLNLVNHGSGSVTLGTAVTVSNGTTSTTLTAGSNYQICYDGTVWRKIN
jgi:hypothetical protein